MLDFVAQALRNADDGEFGGAVEPYSGRAMPPTDGAHTSDHAGFAFAHVGENGAGDSKLAEDVGVELRFRFLVTDFRKIVL